jgi:Polyketide cyclase / dehydrase and lipid transport
MIKKILLAIVILVVLTAGVFAVVVAMQPADYSVQRTATFNAPASTVFAQVNDFHAWKAWSPWEKLDPNAKTTFGGPTAGTGATYSWDGNDDMGAGQMTITKSHPSDLIEIKLEFFRPHASVCKTEFTFKENGSQTAVTWTMSGEKDFTSKAFCLFMDMDKMVGGDFEKGLTSMKSIVESKTNK